MNDFENALRATTNVYVMDPSVPVSDYAAVDLSVDRIEKERSSNPENFQAFLGNYAVSLDAVFLFGGYNEKRNLYKRSSLFKDSQTVERDIHIGLDIWADAGTPVFAALDGIVHSFNFNAGTGNYGPTIILRHEIDQHIFYTLYGHLSLESIENLEIGDAFTQGMRLATLGDQSVNGNYAPHLHFQIIKDLQNNFGDYPGVCSANNLDFYLTNCPDPNLLLKLQPL